MRPLLSSRLFGDTSTVRNRCAGGRNGEQIEHEVGHCASADGDVGQALVSGLLRRQPFEKAGRFRPVCSAPAGPRVHHAVPALVGRRRTDLRPMNPPGAELSSPSSGFSPPAAGGQTGALPHRPMSPRPLLK